MRASELSPADQIKLFGRIMEAPESAGISRAPKESKENLFAFQCRGARLPMFKRNYKFAESIGRGWLMDFAFLDWMVAVEVEGLNVIRVNGELRVGGRHTTIQGFKADCEKYARAAELGWFLIRFEQSQVKDGTALDLTERLLKSRGWRKP